MDRYTLHVERGESGGWFVTSPDDKGLLSVAADAATALFQVPQLLADLQRARAAVIPTAWVTAAQERADEHKKE